MTEECLELRCDAEYLQIPLTQQATGTTVTEGTQMLPKMKKMERKECITTFFTRLNTVSFISGHRIKAINYGLPPLTL